jgi:UDP-N-acetylmuramate: L-alanyl-gamma-D-glutamyl-meso-diaminopimelate ligase
LEDDTFEVLYQGQVQGVVNWTISGAHNRMNALAAIAASHHVGVPTALAIDALGQFQNVKRRMEVRGVIQGITVYDDFAHHPTAIATTIAGLRKQQTQGRILAVLEPRSNTMKLGAVKEALPGSLQEADYVFAYGASSGKDALGWDLAQTLTPLGAKAQAFHDLSTLVEHVVAKAQPHDHILVMSNGGFGGVHQLVLNALQAKFVPADSSLSAVE